MDPNQQPQNIGHGASPTPEPGIAQPTPSTVISPSQNTSPAASPADTSPSQVFSFSQNESTPPPASPAIADITPQPQQNTAEPTDSTLPPATPAVVATTPPPAAVATPNSTTMQAQDPSQPTQATPAESPNIDTPAQQPSPQLPPEPINQQPSKKSKKVPLLIAGIVLIILLSAGYVFGFYLPNRPENVWQTGINRSGDVIEKLTSEVTSADALQEIKKSELSINGNITVPEGTFSANLLAKYDETKLDAQLNVTLQEEDINLTANLLAEMTEGQRFPDTYIKMKGFSGLGLESLLPGVNTLEDQWIAITAVYLEELASESIELDSITTEFNTDAITANDISELSQALTQTSNEYLFTTDEDKAVLRNNQFVARENIEGTDAFHYHVSLNANNSARYCSELAKNIMSTNAFKKIAEANDEEISELISEASKECESIKDEIDEEEVFSMWIDAKYKLIHRLRFYENSVDSDAYMDIGQTYKGGDELTFFADFSNLEKNINEAMLTLTSNFKTLTTEGEFILSGQSEGEQYGGKLNIKLQPHSDNIDTTRPENAIDIEDAFMQILGTSASSLLGSPNFRGSINNPDTEIEADIKAIHGQLEAFFAMTGRYPTLIELNTSNFRETNMRGLEDQALIHPNGNKPELLQAASQTNYGYSAVCSGNECTEYTLTGILSNGSTYSKNSLN
jgi:hypothetical protein